MAILYVTQNNVGNGTRINLGNGTEYHVLSSVLVGSTDSYGMYGTVGTRIFIEGTVSGLLGGIYTDNFSQDTFIGVSSTGVVRSIQGSAITARNSSVDVINSGFVSGDNGILVAGNYATVSNSGIVHGNLAVGLSATSNILYNSGELRAGATGSPAGQFLAGVFASADTVSYINNTGEISGLNAGIRGAGVITLINEGTITSPTEALRFYEGFGESPIGTGVQNITNNGTINGVSKLGRGADLLDSSRGVLNGAVYGESGNDVIIGSEGSDTLYGGADSDVLRGEGGVDYLFGDEGDDSLYFSIEDAMVIGGDGYDRAWNMYNEFGLTFSLSIYSVEEYFGSHAGETILATGALTAVFIEGSGGNDLVIGGSHDDQLLGGSGDDTLMGSGGADTMNGGDGNDRIESGSGNDAIMGGLGSDTFVYEGVLGGNDTIADFEIGRDKIEILRSGFLNPTQWNAGALDPARFVASANPSPVNGISCFLFDNAGPDAGQLYWNDGRGSATGILKLNVFNFTFVTAQDFVLI